MKSQGLKDVLLYLLAKGAPGAASVATTFILIRISGAEVFANYALFTTFIISACAFGVGWINQSQLRFTRLSRHGCLSLRMMVTKAYVHLLGVVAIGVLVLLGLIVALFAWVGVGGTYFDLLPISLALAFHGLYQLNGAALQANLESGKVVTVELLRGGLLLTLPVGAFYALNGRQALLSAPGELAAGFMVSVLLTALMGLYLLRDQLSILSSLRWKGWVLRRTFRRYWSFGWPMSVWLGVSTGMPFIERMILKNYGEQSLFSDYVTHYEVFYRIFALGLFPITMALHPRIMLRFNAGDFVGSNALIAKGVFLQGGIGVVVMAVLLYAADLVAAGMRLRDIEDRYLLVVAMSVAGILWQIALLAHKPLERLNKTGLMVFFVVAAAGVLAVGDLYFATEGNILAFAFVNVFAACVYIALCAGYWLGFGRSRF